MTIYCCTSLGHYARHGKREWGIDAHGFEAQGSEVLERDGGCGVDFVKVGKGGSDLGLEFLHHLGLFEDVVS